MAIAEAYEPPPSNEVVRPVVVGWALFMGAFGAWGWIAANGYSAEGFISACVSLFSCVMLLNASVQMRRAGAKEARRAGLVWLMALGLFGSWSGYSAHHAFEMSQGGPVHIETIFSLEAAQSAFLLAFFVGSAWLDPWLMWAVEETERAEPKAKENQSGSQAHDEPKPTSLKMSPAQARNLSEPDRARAKLLLAQGHGPSDVHRATGVPLSTLKRWAKEAA